MIRADLRDATLRDQGERLVRQDGTAAEISAAWLRGVEGIARRVAGRYSLGARLPGSLPPLRRAEIAGMIEPARAECERILTDALLGEIGLTDDAARALLRRGLPRPSSIRRESLTEAADDVDVPGSPAYTYRARSSREIGIRLGEPVFTEAEAQNLAFSPHEGARWTTRFKRLARETARTVLTQVSAAVAEGWSTDKLVREVAGEVGEGEYSARRIARTELQRAANAAKDRCFREFGDLVAEEECQAAWEETCVECGLLDGRRFRVGEGPVFPLHPHCACTKSPVTRTWRELGLPVDEIEPPGRTLRGYRFRPKGEGWRTWIRKQPADYQKRILGPGRYSLWKRGEISLDRMRAPGGGVRRVKDLRKAVAG